MAKFIRYALATFCFAASVGCLALWWRSFTTPDRIELLGPGFLSTGPLEIETIASFAAVGVLPDRASINFGLWEDATVREKVGRVYGRLLGVVYFSLWFPVFLFALAAVAAIHVGRRFTLRSSLVAVTVVAMLLGMVVALYDVNSVAIRRGQ
jgi:hypothetical protein